MDFNYEKAYTYLRGYAQGLKMTNTLKALGYSFAKHSGQKRRSGEPYIAHPLQMASYAAALGIADDEILAVILLHDVCEDCNTRVEELPFPENIKQGVKYLTIDYNDHETKEQTKIRYFHDLINNKTALIVKGLDRYFNLSTMIGVTKDENIIRNIKETNELLLPVLRDAKDVYPDLSDYLHVIRTNLKLINSTLENMYKEQEK